MPKVESGCPGWASKEKEKRKDAKSRKVLFILQALVVLLFIFSVGAMGTKNVRYAGWVFERDRELNFYSN